MAALVLTAHLSAFAAAPANDLCGGAVVVPASGPFPVLMPLIADISDATTTGDPPGPSCIAPVSRSVWYSFRPAMAGDYAFSVSADTGTTVDDTVMAIYRSPSDCAGVLTEIACNDDAGAGRRSAILTNLAASAQYYIVVWMYDTNAPSAGATALQLRVARPVAPTNDTCATAEVIPGGGQFPYFTTVTDLTKAVSEAGLPVPSCQAGFSKSVWYRFTPAETSRYRISSCADTATTVNDTVMAIYVADGCAGPFTQVACSDDDCDLRAMIDTVLSAGTTYYVVVWEFNTAAPVPGQTLVQLRVSPPPPLFTSTVRLPNGNLRMNFTALANQTYAIEATSTLTNWTEVGTAQFVGSGQYQFTATNLFGVARFFRAKLR